MKARRALYFCNCNGLTDREIADAIRDGAASPAEVLARCGWSPGCGKCVREVAALMMGDVLPRDAPSGESAAPA